MNKKIDKATEDVQNIERWAKDNSVRPAFTETEYYDEKPIGNVRGMSKREYFAVIAMQGILSNPNTEADSQQVIAQCSVEYADELLKQLER